MGDSSPGDVAHDEDAPWAVFSLAVTMLVGLLVREVQQSEFDGAAVFVKKVPFAVWMFSFGLAAGGLNRTGFLTDEHTNVSETDPKLLIQIFFPLLIFESAFKLNIHGFMKMVKSCVFLAGPGLISSVGFYSLLSKLTFGYDWTWEESFLFGCVIAPSDPIAATTVLKELGADSSLSSLVEGESLLNEGTAVMLYSICKVAVLKPDFTWDLSVGYTFMKVCLLGPAIGLVAGTCLAAFLGTVTNNPLTEIGATLASSYALFFVCEEYGGASGVLGLLVMGLFMSSRKFCISPGVEQIHSQFWNVIAYFGNTFVFALAGLVVGKKTLGTHISCKDCIVLVNIYLFTNVMRFCIVFFFLPLMAPKGCVDIAQGVVVSCCGFKGAVGLILAMALVTTKHTGDAEFSQKVAEKILFHTSGLVLLTLLVNGLLSKPLMLYLGYDKIPARRKAAMNAAYQKILSDMQDSCYNYSRDKELVGVNWEIVGMFVDERNQLEDPYKNRKVHPLEKFHASEEARTTYLNALKSNFYKQYEEGALGYNTLRRLVALVDEVIEIPYEPLTCSAIMSHSNTFQFSEKLRKIPFYNNYFLLPMLHNRYEAIVAYIRAQGAAMEAITATAPSKRIVQDLISNNLEEVSAARGIMADFAETFPVISSAIMTKLITRVILNHARRTVLNVLHSGFLENPDADLLLGLVEKSVRRLERANMVQKISGTPMEARRILSEADFTRRITDATERDRFLSGWFIVKYHAEDKIDPEMLHFIIDGLVTNITGNETHGPGSLLLQSDSFSKLRHPDGIAITSVVCACLPPTIFSIFVKNTAVATPLRFYYCSHIARRLLHLSEPFNKLSFCEIMRHCKKGAMAVRNTGEGFKKDFEALTSHSETNPLTVSTNNSFRRQIVNPLDTPAISSDKHILLLIEGTIESEQLIITGPCNLSNSSDVVYTAKTMDTLIFRIPPFEGLELALIAGLVPSKAVKPLTSAASYSSRSSRMSHSTIVSFTSSKVGSERSRGSPPRSPRAGFNLNESTMLTGSVHKMRKSPGSPGKNSGDPEGGFQTGVTDDGHAVSEYL